MFKSVFFSSIFVSSILLACMTQYYDSYLKYEIDECDYLLVHDTMHYINDTESHIPVLNIHYQNITKYFVYNREEYVFECARKDMNIFGVNYRICMRDYTDYDQCYTWNTAGNINIQLVVFALFTLMNIMGFMIDAVLYIQNGCNDNTDNYSYNYKIQSENENERNDKSEVKVKKEDIENLINLSLEGYNPHNLNDNSEEY